MAASDPSEMSSEMQFTPRAPSPREVLKGRGGDTTKQWHVTFVVCILPHAVKGPTSKQKTLQSDNNGTPTTRAEQERINRANCSPNEISTRFLGASWRILRLQIGTKGVAGAHNLCSPGVPLCTGGCPCVLLHVWICVVAMLWLKAATDSEVVGYSNHWPICFRFLKGFSCVSNSI